MNSVFCIFQLEKSRSRAGLAIPVILAFFLTFTIVGFTFLMKSSLRKKSAGLELLTKIKIDYQLESAICMAFNRIKGNSPRLPIDPSMVFNIPKREIFPEIFLSLTPTHFSDDIVFLKAQAQGNGFEKNLTCKVYSQTLPISSATSDPVPVASDSTASTSVRWFIEYLP